MSTTTPPTVCIVAKRLLRDLGIVSLDPATPTKQQYPIEDTDLDDVIGIMNAAFQEIFRKGPSEGREQNLSAVLHAPTTVTLTATNGSTTISGLTTYASWMLGCTIRLAGDDQDNELTSQTQLARPFMGNSGSISATVYGDAVQLDASVQKVLWPVSLPNQVPLVAATSREEFMRLAGYPLVTNADGTAYGYPFFWFIRKSISRPLIWYLEGAYISTAGYVPRRIRVAPMPNQAYALGYRATINPPTFTSADVDSGDHTTDPNVAIPLPDGYVDSIFIPICRQRMTGLPTFKNDGCKQEIARAYEEAKSMLRLSLGQSALTKGRYMG